MKKYGQRQRVGTAGFTLVEVLVVVIILGFLATIAIPSYLSMQREAKISVVKGKLAAIRGGIELAHAKILASGQNTGTDGTNPDWPTLVEVQANQLTLVSRPASVLGLAIVRGDLVSNEHNKALPPCVLPDMTGEMAANSSAVTASTFAQAAMKPRLAGETSGWAYFPGNEKDAFGRVEAAIFYVNDDRGETDNTDGNGRVPSEW